MLLFCCYALSAGHGEGADMEAGRGRGGKTATPATQFQEDGSREGQEGYEGESAREKRVVPEPICTEKAC